MENRENCGSVALIIEFELGFESIEVDTNCGSHGEKHMVDIV